MAIGVAHGKALDGHRRESDNKIQRPAEDVDALKTQLANPTPSTVVNALAYMPINDAYISLDAQGAPTKVQRRTKDHGGKRYTAYIALDDQCQTDGNGDCYVNESRKDAAEGKAR